MEFVGEREFLLIKHFKYIFMKTTRKEIMYFQNRQFSNEVNLE